MSADTGEPNDRSMSEITDDSALHLAKCPNAGTLLSRCLALDEEEATEELRKHNKLLPGESLDSAYTRHEQFHEERWEVKVDNSNPEPMQHLKDALEELGIQDAAAQGRAMILNYHGNNPDLSRSGAATGQYEVYSSPSHGFLVVSYALSAGIATRKNPVNEDHQAVRMLRHWSDIAFLAWQRQCEQDQCEVSCVKYIFVCNVQNEQCKSVLSSLNAIEQGMDVHFRDRKKLAINRQDGKMLLGAPPAAWVLWMLLRQPQMRGVVSVKEISIFGQDFGDDEGDVYEGFSSEAHLFIELEWQE